MESAGKLHQTIGKKLLFYIVLASSSITFIFTMISFAIDYRNEKTQMNKVFFFIERTNLSSITNAVYLLNKSQINSQGTGIFKHPDIIHVDILDEDSEPLFSEKKSEKNTKSADTSNYIFIVDMLPFLKGHTETKVFPLIHSEESEPIGKLSVVLSKNNMYMRLAEKLFVFFATQLLKTLIVSLADC
ncbi:MAG: hypothetical protein AB8G05_03735 [Oligoflexales bacterium]